MPKQIKKILIANRGEIACRVIKTARKMGIATVAVFSDADRKALHVRMADEAVHIGPSPAAESYLVMDKIIDACKQSGADAVHPGYGFLSENPEFARRLKKQGIIFIGPEPESMEAMGLKDAAKKLMEKANVPVTPGYHGKSQALKILEIEAKNIGYPVLIKAVAGGGGKGMRKVDGAKDFEDALASCQREAKSSFGDDRVLIEKYILSPRHIEVQVFGDSHGNVVHMFERDCSLQRRHQKVIEEAPAPGMTDDVRAAMTNAAVKAAQAVDYVGAGTVEFIVDGSGKLRPDGFWFMEMNTRLQVEHPVTEMITGLDLVEWQIRVAQGEKLPKQKDIKMEGHAVEARLYAEDPANDFLPSVGPLKILKLPDDEHCRVDTGVEKGDEVSIYYDPMIAKLICKSKTRLGAMNHLSIALTGVKVWPVKTNNSFLKNLSDLNAVFDTNFIGREIENLTVHTLSDIEAVSIAAIFESFKPECLRQQTGIPKAVFNDGTNWRLNLKVLPQFKFVRDDQIKQATLDHNIGTYTVSVDDQKYTLTKVRTIRDNKPNTVFCDFTLENGIHNFASCHYFDACLVYFYDGQCFEFNYEDHAMEAMSGGNAITSPMPGKILEVRVKPGDTVTKGDKLIVMEAMKMEMSLEAPRDGVIESIDCAPGDLVTDGAVLVSLETE